MSGGFSFPPPPPPPPKPATGHQGQGSNLTGPPSVGRGGRGRRDGVFQQRGRGSFESSGRGHLESRGRARGQQHGRGDQQSRGGGNSNNAVPHHTNGNQRGFWDFGPPPGNSWTGQVPDLAQQWPALYENAPANLPPGSYVNPNFAGRGQLNRNGQTAASRNYAVDNVDVLAGYRSTPGQDTRLLAIESTNTNGPQRTVHGHKRKLEALREPESFRETLSGPQTTPAVPSFGSSMLPPVASAQQSRSEAKMESAQPITALKPGIKSLGLTPQDGITADYQSDSDQGEEDVDEEAQYTELGTKLTFEHNGEVLSLNSAADLAVWKEERRKAWPTTNRVAQKDDGRRRIGDERRRLLADAVSMQFDPHKKVQSSQPPKVHNEQARREPSVADTQRNFETVSAETRLSRIPKDGSVLEAVCKPLESQQHQPENPGLGENFGTSPGAMAKRAIPGIPSDDSEEEVGSPPARLDAESSSDSGSDDEAPPEVSSSKPPEAAAPGLPKKACRYFTASGYCRDGDACRFRHELSARAPHTAVARSQDLRIPFDRYAPKLDKSATSERKSIHDRLVEQEQLEEDRLALQAIKYLGQTGFFSLSGLNTGDSI